MPDSNPELNCETFEEYVQEVLDSRKLPSLDPRVAKHAASCSRCTDELARYERLNRILCTAFQPSTQPSEKGQVTPKLVGSSGLKVQAQPQVLSRTRKPIPVSFVITASLILLTVFLNSLDRNNGRLTPVASMPVYVEPPVQQLQMVSNFRSIERCYEITAEMPGIRPLQSTLSIAYHWCQDYFSIDSDASEPPTESPPSKETNLGVRFDETRFRAC